MTTAALVNHHLAELRFNILQSFLKSNNHLEIFRQMIEEVAGSKNKLQIMRAFIVLLEDSYKVKGATSMITFYGERHNK